MNSTFEPGVGDKCANSVSFGSWKTLPRLSSQAGREQPPTPQTHTLLSGFRGRRMGRPPPPQVRDCGRDGDAGPGEPGAEEHGLFFSPEGLVSFRRLIIAACVDVCARWALLAFS